MICFGTPSFCSQVSIFTGSVAAGDRDRWLARVISGAGDRLASLRDRVIEAARLQRHSLVLDINAGTGLLTWEALRRAPEGGAWLLTPNAEEAAALREMVARLSQVERGGSTRSTGRRSDFAVGTRSLRTATASWM